MTNKRKKKVIIVGAGPAGVACGLEILRQCPDLYDIEIIESSHEIGGISKTVRVGNYRMDIGGHRFFSQDKQIMDWWTNILPLQGKDAKDDKELGRKKELTPNGPDPETEDKVFLKRQRVSRIFYDNTFFDYPISMSIQTLKSMGFKRTLSVGFSYIGSTIHKREENSLENFYINRFGKKLYKMFFEDYTQKLWGRHPSEIAADWGAQRVKGLSVIALLKDMAGKTFNKKENIVETSLIEEFYYPKFGPGQLWEEVADQFIKLGGKITFGETVESINFRKNRKISSILCVTDDEKVIEKSCDYLVSTMALKDMIISMEDNKVPDNIKTIAEGLPYRDFVTVGLLVDTKDMRINNETKIPTLNNVVPDNWIYVQDDNVKLGRLQIFNNWSPYLVENSEKVWLGLEYFCDEGDSFWEMETEDCVSQAIEELQTIGILKKDANISLSHREKVKKAYPAYFDTYNQIDEVIDWVKTINNLYCIGRNGQHRYNNMDHSIMTAILAAKSICGDITKTQNDIWNVNTEENYHESKK